MVRTCDFMAFTGAQSRRIKKSGLADSSNVLTISSRRRAVSFQCTFLRLSPSCHARTPEGEAMSSVMRTRPCGPSSPSFTIIAGVCFNFGMTSTRAVVSFTRRDSVNRPNISVARSRDTPAS